MKKDIINKLIEFFKTRDKDLLDDPMLLKNDFLDTYGIKYQLEISIFCKICLICSQKNITHLDKDYIIYLGRIINRDNKINEKVAVLFLGCYAYIKKLITIDTLKELISYKPIEKEKIEVKQNNNNYSNFDYIDEIPDNSVSDSIAYVSNKVNHAKEIIIEKINNSPYTKEVKLEPGIARARFIARLGLLLAIMGLFMPITCDLNAFQIAQYSTDIVEILLIYLCFFSSCFGVLLLILNIIGIRTRLFLDWIAVYLSINYGFTAYLFDFIKNKPASDFLNLFIKVEYKLQIGGYIFIIGWIISFIFLLIASLQNSKIANKNPKDAPSSGFAFLSFISILLGVILYFNFKYSSPKKAKSCLKGTLFAIFLPLILLILYTIGVIIYSRFNR
jgi:hypothetical protein